MKQTWFQEKNIIELELDGTMSIEYNLADKGKHIQLLKEEH